MPKLTTREGSSIGEQTQQRLETLLAAAIGFGLSRLVAERFMVLQFTLLLLYGALSLVRTPLRLLGFVPGYGSGGLF